MMAKTKNMLLTPPPAEAEGAATADTGRSDPEGIDGDSAGAGSISGGNVTDRHDGAGQGNE